MSGKVQMVFWVLVAALVTAGSIGYIVVAKPPALWETRYGVPLDAPPVLNPVTQQPVALDDLARNYVRVKREHAGSAAKAPERSGVSVATGIQIGMFFLTFYIVYLALLRDPFGK